MRWSRAARRSWRETAFAVLDFEATGLDFEHDHVLSFGIVPVEGGRAVPGRGLYRVVRPPVALPPASVRVHGIRPSELESTPTLAEVLPDLHQALAGRMLVAHAAGVELGFLERIRHRHGGPRFRCAVDVLDLADAVAAANGAATTAATQRLALLAESWGVPVARTHHAFGDALTTAQLFLVLATQLERAGAGSVHDLVRAGRAQFARTSSRIPLDRGKRFS